MTDGGRKPTKADLEAAAEQTLPDVIGPGLRVLFCGINPGLYSAAVGHHFARPGNRFWPALYAAGFTDRLLSPFEDKALPAYGCGLTNLVSRATAGAHSLERRELEEGARQLEAKVARFRPRLVAVVGIGAYRVAFGRSHAAVGRQPELLAGARLWVLPNPSGANAHHTPADLARLFGELRQAAVGSPASP